ncbi:MAG: hypothetical protein AAF799_05460 [Myxococcota bacterium]
MALTSCSPSIVPTRSNDGGSTTDAATSDDTGSPSASSSSTSSADTTEASPTDATGLDEPGVSFVDDTDIGIALDCDVYAQDCPAGQKCTWWNGDVGSPWSQTRCVPIADDTTNPGEPCTVLGTPYTGLDDCRLGAMCWDVDSETLEGTCVALCTGNWDNPICESPDSYCATGGDGIAVCVPACSPLQPGDCAEGQGCYPVDDDWVCAPDASGEMGAYGDPCEFINVCDPGLVCVGSSAVPGCEGSGCCTNVCDLDDPQCNDTELGVECVPWYDSNAPFGYEHLGACVLPEK